MLAALKVVGAPIVLNEVGLGKNSATRRSGGRIPRGHAAPTRPTLGC